MSTHTTVNFPGTVPAVSSEPISLPECRDLRCGCVLRAPHRHGRHSSKYRFEVEQLTRRLLSNSGVPNRFVLQFLCLQPPPPTMINKVSAAIVDAYQQLRDEFHGTFGAPIRDVIQASGQVGQDLLQVPSQALAAFVNIFAPLKQSIIR